MHVVGTNMLSLLKIRNLALVDELVWEIGPGLVGVTGETGAGKSVIVGALKLVLGERADKSMIRSGMEECTIEAVFDMVDTREINAVLGEGGIAPCDDPQLIIRRVIGTKISRQFVNDSPVTLGLLKRLGSYLVDLHGPHDHQSLLSIDRQLVMLDAFAGAERILEKYRDRYQEWRERESEYEEIRSAEHSSEREIELLKHLIEEVDSAGINPGDEEALEERWRRARNGSRLLEASSAMVGSLSGSGGVLEVLADVQRYSRELQKLDPTMESRLVALETAMIELQDLDRELTDYAGELEIDAEETTLLEERVSRLENLKRKYGPSLLDVFDRRAEAVDRLDTIENRGEKLESLEKAVDKARDEVVAVGRELGMMRRRAAPKLAMEIANQLMDLGFKQSTFRVDLEALVKPGANGLETVEFQFGPNQGEPVLPLRQIASSGEVSRVMLAVKSALADQDAIPLMVFDEIDANVGGEVARAVGRKMATLGMRHQVVAITHFPQVAASADQHFVVEKTVTGGRTRSQLRPVSGETRVSELVRMLGGGGEQARAMAHALLRGE